MSKIINLALEKDHIDSLTKANGITTLSELIWNALDADASEIRINYTKNGLNGYNEITISDYGHGLKYEKALHVFGSLEGSEKSLRTKVQTVDYIMGKKEFKIKIKHRNIKYQIMSKIEKASVQYNDMKGSAALDFHGSFTELWDFARDQGIDTKKYEPIGIDVYYGESNYFGLTFLVIDKEKAENRQYFNGLLPVIEIGVEVCQKDFERRFKRFNIKLTRLGMNLENYELIDSIHISDQIEDSENIDEI